MSKVMPNDLSDLIACLNSPRNESDSATQISQDTARSQKQDRKRTTSKLDTEESVITELKDVILTLMNHTPISQVELERQLDAIATTIKRKVKPEHTRQAWFSQAASVTTRLVWSYPWVPKLEKKVIKVIVEMERHAAQIVEKHLEPFTEAFKTPQISIEDLGTWYSFMETSRVARSLTGRCLSSLVSLLNFNLKRLLRGNQPWTIDRQQWLQLLLKTSIQMFQHLPKEVGNLLYHSERTEEFESLVSLIIRILASTEVPSHCMPMAGTAVAFLLCLSPSDEQIVNIFRDLYMKLGSEDVITIGSIGIRPSPLNEDVSNQSVLRAHKSFGHLALLNGLLSCVRSEVLNEPIVSTTSQQELFITWLFDIVVGLCDVPEHQYHSFRLLTTWYQRLAKHLAQGHANDERGFFAGRGVQVAPRTLSLVWTHLDSPVDGINELVVEAFGMMLKLHSADESVQTLAASLNCDARQSELLADVLSQTLGMSWTIKGKHSLVATLIPYINVIEFIEKEKDLFPELLNCLSTNYLAPASTIVYRAILQQLAINGSGADFSKYCLPWLVQGLTNECSLLRQNTSHYWLAATLKHSKDTYPVIFNYIKNLDSVQQGLTQGKDSQCLTRKRRFLFHGLVAVMKAGRAHQLLKSESMEVVRKALCHQDDDVRLDAFAILCVSQKISEPLRDVELKLLRERLPDNMTSDSAPFRQRMVANLRALLIRLRDSALSRLKARPKGSAEIPEEVSEALDFVDWFWKLLMKSLFPGASYQRLKSSMDWVLLVLNTFSYQPHRHQRKGNTPDTVRHLLDVAASQGQCDFYSPTNTRLILTCLLHGTDEIREMTAGILLDFFPWPLKLEAVSTAAPPTGETEAPPGDAEAVAPSGDTYLVQTGLRLCNSAKPHESESGAALIKMIFQKLVLEKKEALKLNSLDCTFESGDESDCLIDEQQQSNDPEYAAQKFICQMVSLVQQSLTKTHKNTLDGARKTPIHGLLVAVRRCLSEAGLKYSHAAHWAPVMEQLLNIVSKVLDTVLDVLGGKVHQDETAPSFEEMGKAISATIAESVGDEAAENELLTSDHRLLMTWTWVNIKECSVLLGSLVESLPIETSTAPGALTRPQVLAIGDMFLKVLLQCRHRGAIEGCNLGLARFCEQLLRSADHEIHAIPKGLLTKVLSQIQRSDVNLSVTRRSAGLPLIITTIVTSESKTRQNVLLSHVVTTLLCLADVPVREGDQRADMPQVHAMNVLKAVLKEASVAMTARQYLPRALIIAIEGFASPHWAIQNAATQLFGVLVSRMLGQKRTHEDHVDMMTMPEFFAHYPTLEEFLLRHLEAGAAEQRSAGQGSLRLQPTTFPVLSILARLSSGNLTQYQASVSKFNAALTQLLGCPVYAVRDLAAQSLASLTPTDQLTSSLQQTFQRLGRENDQLTFNRLHGDVVLSHYLLNRFTSSNSNREVLHELLPALYENAWLASTRTSPLVRARYVQLLLDMSRLCESKELPAAVSSCLEHLVQESLQPEKQLVGQKVGWDQAVKPLVRWFLSNADCEEKLIPRVKRCLASADADIVLTALESIAEQIPNSVLPKEMWYEVQVEVCGLALSNPHCSVGAAALNLIVQTGTPLHELGIDSDVLWTHLMTIIMREKNSRQAGPALCLTATLLAGGMPNHTNPRLDEWSPILSSCCNPQNAEWLHLHAAKAISTLVPFLVEQLKQEQVDSAVIRLAFVLFAAGLRLLVNEHPSVRQEAANFVAQLHAHLGDISVNQPLHTALAVQMLCEVTFSLLGEHALLFRESVSMIHKQQRLALSDLVAHESKMHVEDLFEAEDTNYYREAVALTETICSCHKKRLQSGGVVLEFSDTLLSNILDDLEDALPTLRILCSGSGPVNVSCSPRVYETLWADLQIMSVLVGSPCVPLHPALNQRCVRDLLLQYAHVPFLHSHLQKTAFNLAMKFK